MEMEKEVTNVEEQELPGYLKKYANSIIEYPFYSLTFIGWDNGYRLLLQVIPNDVELRRRRKAWWEIGAREGEMFRGMQWRSLHLRTRLQGRPLR